MTFILTLFQPYSDKQCLKSLSFKMNGYYAFLLTKLPQELEVVKSILSPYLIQPIKSSIN